MKHFLNKILPLTLAAILIVGSIGYWQYSKPETAQAAPAWVQTKNFQNSGGAVAATFTGAVAVNNLIVVTCVAGQNTVNFITGVTDTASVPNTYARATSTATSGVDAEIWYAVATHGGAFKVTCTPTTSTPDEGIIIQEFSGVATASPLDKTHGAVGTATTANSGSTITTTQAAELVVGSVGYNNGGLTLTVGATYSNLDQVSIGGGFEQAGQESKSVAVTGTYNATFGGGGSNNWAANVATFKATGGGGGGGSTKNPQLIQFGFVDKKLNTMNNVG